MWSFLSAALSSIPAAATSQLALIAYGMAIVAFIVTVWRVTRNRNLLQNLQRLRPDDRLVALEIEMGGVRLETGISPEQWLRSKIHRYYFFSFVITCFVALVIIIVAITNSDGSADISVDLYQKSSLEPSKDNSLLGNLVKLFTIGKSQAEEAEFIDPNTLAQKSAFRRIDRLLFAADETDKILRYDYQKKSANKITIIPILGYADKQRSGKVINGFSWWWQPFEWEFPALSIKIANNTKNDLLLSEVVFKVSDSVEDNRPIIVVRGPSYFGNVVLHNEGWGPVANPKVSFDIRDPRQCKGATTDSFKATISLPTFLKDTSFPIKQYVPDSMIDELKSCERTISDVCMEGRCIGASELGEIECLDEKPREVCSHISKPASDKLLRELREESGHIPKDKTPEAVRYERYCTATPVCVVGELDYQNPGGGRSDGGRSAGIVKFATIVVLEPPGAGAPAPPSYIYDVRLEAGKKGYTLRKSIWFYNQNLVRR